MLTLIRGAGDLATGIALRLYRAGIEVVMTDVAKPTALRRTVAFCEAIRLGEMRVEDIYARRAESVEDACALLQEGIVPVLVDEDGTSIEKLRPQAVVDAILAKRNLGTRIDMAPCVIGVGPGFTAGVDCHAVVETMRGHTLGRVIHEGSALPNTGVPGMIGGYAAERVLHAPCDGILQRGLPIGMQVCAGDTIAVIDGMEMKTTIDGVLRGILPDGTRVFEGMKSADVDPRGVAEHCMSASDKAFSVGGGVLEAILGITGALKQK